MSGSQFDLDGDADAGAGCCILIGALILGGGLFGWAGLGGALLLAGLLAAWKARRP